jgi:sugar phosphate permease
MVFIVDEGYMTKFETGTISAAFWAVYAVTQLFGGVLADKFKPENLITIGLLGSGVINLAIFFCYENYLLTIILWSLNAALQIGGWPASFKIISSMVHESQRSKGTVVLSMMSPAGVLASYVVAAFVVKWQQNFLISAIGSFALMVLWIISTKSTERYVVTENVGARGTLQEQNDSVPKIKFFRLAIMSGLVFLLLLSFLRSFITQIQTLIPTMINESYEGVAPSFATVLSFVVLICNALGPILGSKLSRFLKNEMFANAILFSVMIPMGAVTLLLGRVNYWFIIAATACIVLCASATSYFAMTLSSIVYIKWGVGATVAGIVNSAAAFGIVGANFLLTLIAEEFGWGITLITITALIVISAILAFIGTPIWKNFKKLELH